MVLFRVEIFENGFIIMKMLWKIMYGISVEDVGNVFFFNQVFLLVYWKFLFLIFFYGSEDEVLIDSQMEFEYSSE